MNKIPITYKNTDLDIYCHSDLIYNLICSTNTFFEEWLLTPLKDKINSFDFTIDIGANIGNHSLFFKKICNANRVICFEPLKENFELLKLNCPDCELYDYAVSSTKGIGSLQILNDINNNSGTAKLIPNINGETKYITLDSFNFEKVTFIKIDVEGHELEVLKGALNTIDKYKPDLLIELHLGIYFQDILNILPKGYIQEYIGKENHFIFKYKNL